MEKIFQKISLGSASLVFIILIGIFATLFNAAKPAIDEFGFNFIINKDWNKEVVVGGAQIDTTLIDKEISDEDDIMDEDDMIMDEDEEMILDDEDDTLTTTIYGDLFL